MSKSAKLLHLDPFAAALQRKEREAAGGQSQPLREAAPPPRTGGQEEGSARGRQETIAGTQAILLREAILPIFTGGQEEKEREDISNNAGGQPVNLREASLPKAGGHTSTAGGNLPAVKRIAGGNLPAKQQSGRPQKETTGGRNKERRPADHKKLSLWFSRSKISEWKQFAVKTELTLTEFLDLAASRFIDSMGTRIEETAGGNPPHDDLMIFRTSDDIIIMYKTHTSNRWKVADDRVASEFNDVDIRIVELGIVQALFRVEAKKINSFKYFIGSIQEAMEMTAKVKMSGPSLDDYLTYARGKLEEMRKKREGKL